MKRSKSFSIVKRKEPSSSLQKNKDPSKQKVSRPSQMQQTKPPQTTKSLSVPDAIKKHIEKRSDVEIIVYYEQYKEQFFVKCKKVQQYIYKNPPIRQKYLGDDNPHFRYALQYLMLDLYHRGVIVPNSYDNMRMEAVLEIQNWMLSWIQRKLLYEKAAEEEKFQIIKTCEVLSELEDYVKIIQVEELPF